MHDRHHSVRRSSARARLEVGAVVAVLTAAMCAPLMACADSAAKHGATKHSKAPASMTTAPMKANSSGVAVSYRIEATPQAGTATTVTLKFDGVTDPAGATVRLSVDAGLSLVGASTLTTVPANTVTTLTVGVVPAAAGIAYLNVFTTQHGVTGATSIPVQVGKAPSAMPSSGELKQTPSGDKVLSMPVK